MAEPNRSNQQSPTVAILIGLAMIMFFCTVLWLAARRQMANIYGMMRSVEFPIIWEYLPGAANFKRDILVAGHTPNFSTIYLHSTYIGMFFLAMIAIIMLLSLIRLEKFGIKKHMEIKSPYGLSPEEVMGMYAELEPSVQFFKDYPLLELSTTRGDGRQPMKAMEVIEAAGALKGIDENFASGELPSLRIDEAAMRKWFVNRLGPENPFTDFQIPALETAPAVEAAIDKLSWTAVLILYPALWKKHSFIVDSKKGFENTIDQVDGFIADIWRDLNALKKREGDRLVLGFDDEDDRAIKNSLYIEKMGGKRKTKKKAKAKAAEGLITFGELLADEGEQLPCVATAREGLKRILTRHLGRDTKEYPLSEGKDGFIVYGSEAKQASEQAYMQAMSKKLDGAAKTISKDILFSHQYLYGLVGAALESVRKTGIMPALNFRWLRFYDKPFWYFIENLGMPSAFPENAAAFEHYAAERIAKIRLSVPYIETAINGLRIEAEKYLVEDEKIRIAEEYGREAVRRRMTDLDIDGGLMEKLLGTATGGAAGALEGPDTMTSPDSKSEAAPANTDVGVLADAMDDPETETATSEEALMRDSKQGLGKFF